MKIVLLNKTAKTNVEKVISGSMSIFRKFTPKNGPKGGKPSDDPQFLLQGA